MRTLAFSYNVNEPFAALIENGRQVEYILERGYYELVNPNRIFPDNAVKQILSRGNIDSVVFLGKPLPYLENLILLHRYLFPGAFGVFMKDVSDYFNKVLALPKFVRQTQDDIDLAATRTSRKRFYYVRVDEALAYGADAEGGSLIITCLTDVFEGSSFCCFEKTDAETRLIKESNALNSFGNLLRIDNETKDRVNLGQLVEISEEKLFRFKKSYITIKNNCFAVKDKHLCGHGSFHQANDELLLNAFSRLMAAFDKQGRRIIFISDCAMPSMIMESHTDVVFRQVEDRYKVESAGKYLFDKVNGPDGDGEQRQP